MARSSRKMFVGLAVFFWFTYFAPCSFAVPSVGEVLKIAHENRDKFNPLHVQLKWIEERTEAYGKAEQKNAANKALLLIALEDPNSGQELEKQVPGISSPQYKPGRLPAGSTDSSTRWKNFAGRSSCLISGDFGAARVETTGPR